MVGASCGGATDTSLIDGGGGGGDGSVGNDGSGGNDATADGPRPDAGAACAALQAQIDAARKSLRTCCPTCKSIQCQGKAKDVCCDITTNGADPKAFETLVDQFKNQCKPICPGAPCPQVPSGICDPSGSDPNAGTCR
jgi:hypothetical protein